MSWLKKLVPGANSSEKKAQRGSSIPEGLWKKCPRCESVLYRPELDKTLDVCPKCDHHMRIGARRR
ncbi:MAG: acetyl-CoA carboxylase carboxyl transferase subunit beta, partial [Pseudomonadales bacterium]|nr:acetyl-CoA carboxylase carboxyl transferase subunit beta [Pseudomonadales bacterium]